MNNKRVSQNNNYHTTSKKQ